ncbi:MAG: fimbrillin family protein [Bacteroidaceae bacterium]|nr:fimbrillin family protein [Bacteroidaceae bacterium]
MKKIFFFTFLTAAFLAACSSDDQDEPKQEPRLITVEVTENPLLDANGTPKQLPTRTAAATTSETLSAFFMNYKGDYKYDCEKSGETWNTNPNTWPVSGNDTKIDFYAYNAGTFNWISDNPYLSFTMDASASNQTDLLVATHKDISYNDAKGKVSLDFDHACAAVKFNIYKTAGVGKKSVTVTSVVLSGVKNHGNYNYNSEGTKWSSLSGSASYTLTTGDITLTTSKQALPCDYLFLIPQSKVGLTLTVYYTVDGSTETHYAFNLKGTWEAGKEYIVNISMGTSIIN